MNYKAKLNREETGLRIYRAIYNSRFTYEDIADFLGLNSPRVIYEWTKGVKMPSLENLINLTQLLHIQMEDILVI